MLNIFAAGSLMLFAIVVVLWIRSYWLAYRSTPAKAFNYEHGNWTIGRQLLLISSCERGRMVIGWDTGFRGGMKFGWAEVYLPQPRPYDPRGGCRWRWWEFGIVYHSVSEYDNLTTTWRCLVFPHWFAAILTAILPAIVVLRWRRDRRRIAEGHCQSCGYDLRATPDRCPECGTIPQRLAREDDDARKQPAM